MTLIRYFAAAAEAAGRPEEPTSAATLGELLDGLAERPGLAEVVARCSILIDGVRSEDRGARIDGAALVDVLPPFAGG
ncbi:MoaD/ThiS family protein [Agromyces archimandritae]|uniref:MoaD/ThiS family protein n=1 Tax=Agromyces archimandritae TaxID=2781962 RepID=A0A975FKQ0_9MICO|nr:MoaD/ThiS family protein [Agromyces archimandritae]QTX03864.1 MoaD/ThiS family protein [Agromyces archimandritae]